MTIIDNKTRQQQQPKTRRLALTETNCNQQSFKVKPRTPQETSRSVRHKNNMNNTKLYPSNCILPTVYFQLYFGTTNVTLNQAANIASITQEQIRYVSVPDYFITVNL